MDALSEATPMQAVFSDRRPKPIGPFSPAALPLGANVEIDVVLAPAERR